MEDEVRVESGSAVARARSMIAQLRGRVIEGRTSHAGEGKLVREAMSSRVATVEPEAPVARAAEQLAEQDVGALAVCGADQRLRAVITDRDIVVRTVAQGLDPERLSAGECGTEEPVTVSPWATLEQAAELMEDQQVRRLPVIQTGRVVGMISQADLAAHGADQRVGRLVARLAQRGGDRRSASWLLQHPYREEDSRGAKGRGVSLARGRLPGGSPGASTVASIFETPPSVYLGGLGLGVCLAALLLGQLGLLRL